MVMPGDSVRVDVGDDIRVDLVEESPEPPASEEPPADGLELESLRRWTIDTDGTPGAKTTRGGYPSGADKIVPMDEAEPGAERSGTFVGVTVHLRFDRATEEDPGIEVFRRAYDDDVVLLRFGFDDRREPVFEGEIQGRHFTCEEFGEGRALLESRSSYHTY